MISEVRDASENRGCVSSMAHDEDLCRKRIQCHLISCLWLVCLQHRIFSCSQSRAVLRVRVIMRVMKSPISTFLHIHIVNRNADYDREIRNQDFSKKLAWIAFSTLPWSILSNKLSMKVHKK